MKWFNIFKLYNIKKVKSEKLIIVFTALSIFITTLISLIVPQITENTKEYMSSSIKKLNGAELMIQGQYPSSKFNKEIDALKSEGYEVNPKYKDKKFKGTRIEVDSIYLTREDLDKIMNLDISKCAQGYALARDIFMVGVSPAQRISDYNNLSR